MKLSKGEKEMESIKNWYISYRAVTEYYPEEIVWSVRVHGTLPEVINWLYKEEEIIEIVDMYEI
jgi:hypothetical protein